MMFTVQMHKVVKRVEVYKDLLRRFTYIGSSNRDFRTLTVDSGHIVEAISVKLVVIYSVCFAKSTWMDIAFNNTCE